MKLFKDNVIRREKQEEELRKFMEVREYVENYICTNYNGMFDITLDAHWRIRVNKGFNWFYIEKYELLAAESTEELNELIDRELKHMRNEEELFGEM